MSTPLYHGRFVSKKGATVQFRLTLSNPDVTDYGTDALFAWKLLSDWVSPEEHDGDEVADAARFIKSVKVAAPENATIDEKHPDFVTVKRKGKKDPSVVYTITVTDASLLEPVNVGDEDEVYQYVEPGRGATKPAKAKAGAKKAEPAKKGKGAAPEIEPKTMADLRETALALIESNKRNDTWSEYVLRYLPGWVADASDDTVKKWLSHLAAPHEVAGLGLAAVERLRAGRGDSAKDLVRLAESKLDDKEIYGAFHALPGLAPAWWKLGETKKADALFERVRAEKSLEGWTGGREMLAGTAALGGRGDLLDQVLPQAFLQGDYGADHAIAGIVGAMLDKQDDLAKKLLQRWSDALKSTQQSYDLTEALTRRLRGEPERAVEACLAWPKVVANSWNGMPFCLREVERRDPAAAVAFAERILANEDISLQETAAAILATHAPAKASEWAAKNAKRASSAAMLAALGRNDEAAKAAKSARYPGQLYPLTTDAALAIAQAKASLAKADGDLPKDDLCALADLGERQTVDDALGKRFAEVGKLAPRDRDLRCRYLAATATTLGRLDIAFGAAKLPTPATKQYSAREIVSAAAKIGELGVALAALALVPDDGSNGRVSEAVQGALRGAEEGPQCGPYAVPLRARSATYVRSWIARGDRAAVEWIAVAGKGQLPADAQVEIDRFLEGGKRASG